MKCRKCGAELKKEAKFCSQCGEIVKRYCTECGREMSALQRICVYCGANVIRNENEEKTESNIEKSTLIQEETVSENKIKLAKDNLIKHQQENPLYDNLVESQNENILKNNTPWKMQVENPVAERTRESFSEEFQPSEKKGKGKKGIFVGSLLLLIAGAIIFFVWIGSGTELSEYISLAKDDVAKFISEQGLTDENGIGIYSKDGLMVFLTEKGNIDTLSIESPEYKLYGIKVGDEFTVLGDSRKLSSHGFGFLDEIEAEAGKVLYYGALSINKDKPGYGQMIQIYTDKDDRVTEISYSKSGANEIAENLDGSSEGLYDGYGSEYLWESDDSAETKSHQETSSRKPDDERKAMELAKQYEGEWWDLNSQRCYMNIEAVGGNKLSIIVSWSNGYADDSKWEMTGLVDGSNGDIIYNDCTQYDIHYDESIGTQKTIHYMNGSGYFFLGNDGYLYWEDKKEGIGVNCYFEKDSGSSEITGTQEYIVDVPLGSGTTMYVVQCKASITLRNAPSSNAAEITQIPLYASIEYFGTLDNGFAQVAYNGQVGYVLSSYLDYYEPQAYTGIKCQIVNCRQSVTLRTSITAQDKEICQIPLGTVIDYIDEGANGYCLVNYNGVMGYVNQDYLLFFSE